MNTFGKQFYPTPEHIISKMYYEIGGGTAVRGKYILDPSAGSGAILQYIKDRTTYNRWDAPAALHAVEIDPDLRAVLAGKEIPVVGDDFLQFSTFYNYDIILMNPPFSEGAKHLLRAWDIAGNTEIVCLLNKETIENPHTEERRLLLQIIQDNDGKITDLGKCFSTANRKTDVDVVMVRLSKKGKTKFEFDPGSFQAERVEMPEDLQSNVPAVHDALKSYENAYAASVDAFAQLTKSWQRFKYVSETLQRDSYVSGETWFKFVKDNDFNGFVRQFNGMAWEKILQKSRFKDYLTQDVQKSFIEKFAQQKEVAFTKENMLAMLEILWLNKGQILADCVEEVFDKMTRYHDDNRVHVEGWKHNDAYMVSEKVVLPREVSTWLGRYTVDSRSSLNDIDRAMCHLTGKKASNIKTITKALEEAFEKLKGLKYGAGENYCESHFFELRFFKKGTLHLKFKDRKLWELFNQTVAKHKGWLMGTEGQSFQRNRKAA